MLGEWPHHPCRRLLLTGRRQNNWPGDVEPHRCRSKEPVGSILWAHKRGTTTPKPPRQPPSLIKSLALLRSPYRSPDAPRTDQRPRRPLPPLLRRTDDGLDRLFSITSLFLGLTPLLSFLLTTFLPPTRRSAAIGKHWYTLPCSSYRQYCAELRPSRRHSPTIAHTNPHRTIRIDKPLLRVRRSDMSCIPLNSRHPTTVELRIR